MSKVDFVEQCPDRDYGRQCIFAVGHDGPHEVARPVGMTNAETVAHLRAWQQGGAFSWPTDACGYDQHMKFVAHRNRNWSGGTGPEWRAFVLAYADQLEKEQP